MVSLTDYLNLQSNFKWYDTTSHVVQLYYNSILSSKPCAVVIHFTYIIHSITTLIYFHFNHIFFFWRYLNSKNKSYIYPCIYHFWCSLFCYIYPAYLFNNLPLPAEGLALIFLWYMFADDEFCQLFHVWKWHESNMTFLKDIFACYTEF